MFVQPYMQTKLTLYEIETVLMPILDANDKAQSYTQLKVKKTLYSSEQGNIYFLAPSGIKYMQQNRV